MKTCPVCKARCFDDMDTCFGCLQDFRRKGASGPLHAKPPAWESSLEDDLEPEEAVMPGRKRAVGAAQEAAAPVGAGIALAPDLSMGVPPGYRLVLRFEPLE